MAKEILENFEMPSEDLYLQNVSDSQTKEKKSLIQTAVTIPKELLEKVSLSDLSTEQVSNMLFADYMVKYLSTQTL